MPSVFKIVRIICFVVSLGYSLQCSAQAFDLNTGISYQKIFVYEDTMGRLHMPKTYEMNLLHTYDSNQIIIFKPSNKKSVFWIEYVFRCSWTGNASVILNGRGLKDSITSYNYSIQSRPDEHGEYVSAPRKPGTEEYLTNKYIYEYSLQASTSDNFIVRLHTYGVTIQAKLDIYYDAGKIVHIGEVMFYCAMVLMVLILFVSVIIFYYDKNFVNILFILFSASSIIDISVIHFYFSHSPFTYAQEGFWRELTLTSLHAAYSCFVFFAFLSHFLFPVKKQSVWAKLFFLCYGIFMILEIAGDFAPYSKFQYMLRDTTFIKDFLVITSGVSYLIVVYTKLHTKQKAYFILTGIALAVYYSGFLWRGKSGLHPVYKELISYSFVLAECCLLFACVIHLFLEGKKEKKRNFEKANEEMNAILLNQIVKTEEAERRRMSQDLHDDLGGTLSRLKLHMTQLNKNDYVENEDFKKYRDESIQILDAALSDLRQISHNLMPKDFSHVGLKESLLEYIDKIHQSKLVKMNLVFDIDIRLVDKDMQLAVYRIISELIQNIMKHSKASMANILILGFEEYFQVMVEDNGVGFDVPVKTGKGLGLQNVNSRVLVLKGKMSIDSGVPGTTVIIEIPYRK